MAKNTQSDGKNAGAKKRDAGLVLGWSFNLLGILMLLSVILTCLPLVIPRLLGSEAFGIVSGSMEPNIPIGSLIFTEPVDPNDVLEGEVIAFQSGDAVVAHRVMRNAIDEQAFVTKGDANPAIDFNSVPYSELIGRVSFHIPYIGRVLMLYASPAGKISAAAVAVSGLIFTVLGGMLTRGDGEENDEQKRIRRGMARGITMGVLLLIFALSGAVVLSAKREDRIAAELYEDASDSFTAVRASSSTASAGEREESEEELPPITVDFDRLLSINEDIIGWLYCEDTNLNYPLLKGPDNDYYLYRGYDGSSHSSGSIFEEETNERGFVDSNVILYGHHMHNGSMLAKIDRWQDQAFYEAHPVIWILTPEGDYRMEVFSAYKDQANSDTYHVYHEPSEEFTEFLGRAAERSLIRSDVELDPEGHYVMLSTCAYEFHNARDVVFGMLVSVPSAGGKPIA